MDAEKTESEDDASFHDKSETSLEKTHNHSGKETAVVREGFLSPKKEDNSQEVNQIYEPYDDESSPQLASSESKLAFSDNHNSNELMNKSPLWNSSDHNDSLANNYQHGFCERPPDKTNIEFKSHFNLDMFHDSYNNSPYNSDPQDTNLKNIIPNEFNVLKNDFKDCGNNVSSQPLEECALKSLERYSPTADDDEEEEEEDLPPYTKTESSNADDTSQLVSFGINSISQEARMLDIPLPPPIDITNEAPLTSFHNILQLPSSPSHLIPEENKPTLNIDTLQGKSQVARLTFGKQMTKLKPTNIFSTEDSDTEIPSEKLLLPYSFDSNTRSAQLNTVTLDTDNIILDEQERYKTGDSEFSVSAAQNKSPKNETNSGHENISLQARSECSPLKKSRWDNESGEDEKNVSEEDVPKSFENLKESSDLGHADASNNMDNNNLKNNNSRSIDTPKERNQVSQSKERDRKRRRERSYSKEREKVRRNRDSRILSSRNRHRSSNDMRRDSRRRAGSNENRSRKGSPGRDRTPVKNKTSPLRKKSLEVRLNKQHNDSEGVPSIDGSKKNEDQLFNEPSTTDFLKDVQKEILFPIDNFELPVKKEPSKSPLKHLDSPKRKRSPAMSPRTSPLRKKSDPFRRKDSPPPRRRSPEGRRDSPLRRFSPRRSPRRRSPLERRRPSPYSPRQFSPLRHRSPERLRLHSPGRRKFSPRHRSPVKLRSYSISPTKDDAWKWHDNVPSPDGSDRFNKWDYENSQNAQINDYQTSLADSTISDSELIKEVPSPKRMSLDERLRIELGHSIEEKPPPPPPSQSLPYQQVNNYYYPPPAAVQSGHVNYFPPQNFNQPPPAIPDWNSPAQHQSLHPNKLLQVGNVLQVVPNEQPVEPKMYQLPVSQEGKKADKSAGKKQLIRPIDSSVTKVVQVGNVLQVVPTTDVPPLSPKILSVAPTAATVAGGSPPPPPPPTAASEVQQVVLQPSQPISIIGLPFPPGSPNIFRKMEEKEKKKQRKERKERKAARRMLRKAKMRQRLAMRLSEVEAGLTPEDLEVVPINVEFDASGLYPFSDKGIMRPSKGMPSKGKKVSFADGIIPGEGTSPSGGEEHPISPPPSRKTPKKRKKRKVKVRIIRIENNSKEEESEEDDRTPPPPPPGTPPPEAYTITASGRYLYPVTSQPFKGTQEGVFPPPSTNTALTLVQFSNPTSATAQQR